MPNQRDIVLIPIPYTDLKGSKIRPALVISDNVFNGSNQDIILCAVTSQPPALPKYCIEIKKNDLESGNLKCDSNIQAHKIFTIRKSRVIKKWGKITADKYKEVVTIIDALIN